MKKRILILLLSLALALGLSGTALAAAEESSTATVSVTELSPGYYLCAVWDGEELLRLFDYTVGADGKLDATVEVGKVLPAGSVLTVGVSSANTGSAAVPPVAVTVNSAAPSVPSTPDERPVYPNYPNYPPYPGYPIYPSYPSNPGSSANPGSSSAASPAPETSNSLPNTNVPAPAVPYTQPFTDVPAGAYYRDAVAWAVANGVTTGTSDTTFSPENPCTRAQIVTFLWRAAGSPAVSGGSAFTDVAPGAYYYDAVAWAVANGITTGTSATTFSPDDTCTRARAVTFLHRANGSPAAGSSSVFTDVESGAYYADAVAWAVANNVTTGTSATTFSPNADCTRAQIVTFLYRAMVD